MPLPTEKTPKKNDIRDLTIFIYGPPKIGKSTFASQFDGALFLATEPGLNHLETFQVEIKTWEAMLATCREIATGKHQFKMIVIDTIDNLYKLCTEYICKLNGNVTSVADIGGYGKGFAILNNEFHRVINQLAMLPYGLILISHEKTVEIDERTGKYTKAVSTLSDGARRIVTGLCDMILHFGLESQTVDGKIIESRIIRTKPTKFFEAGDRTGRLPAAIMLDHAAFMAAWEKSSGNKQTENKQTETKPTEQPKVKG